MMIRKISIGRRLGLKFTALLLYAAQAAAAPSRGQLLRLA